MNRETVIAIVFGILLGAGAGVVVLFQTTRGEEAKVIPVTGETDQKKVVHAESTTQEGNQQLTISSPENHVVVHEDTITVQGKAQPDSLIIIQSPVTEQVFKNENADFTKEIDLALGENVIQISAYGESSTPQEHILRIYYIEE